MAKEWLAGFRPTQSELPLPNAQSGDSGNYSVIVSNWLGSVTSAAAQLYVGIPPSITTQPIDQTAPPGRQPLLPWSLLEPLLLRINGAGTHPTFPEPHRLISSCRNVQAQDEALYDVVVSNLLGVAESDSAFLTVGSVTAPTIVSQPLSKTVPPGGSVTFSVLAFGSTPLYYQWLRYATNLPGATTSDLTLTNLQPSDAGPYTVLVTNLAGSALSQIANLTVGGTAFSLSMAVREWNSDVNLEHIGGPHLSGSV
jgi:hypothetical protein